MKKITVNQIKDFQICERLYDFRHNQDLPETIGGRTIMTQRFENTMKNVVQFFFYKKQSGIIASYSSLLNRWQKLWYPKDTTAYDIMHEQHESFYGNNASLTTKAASALLNLVENFSDSEIIPIGIDAPFMIPMSKTAFIEDSFDLIYSLNKKTYVVKWVFNYKLKNEFMHVADFAIMYKGFEHCYGSKVLNTKFGYYDLINSKPEFVEYQVNHEDLDALKYWTMSIENEQIFPSRRGVTTYCKQCPYDKPCAKWDKWFKKETVKNEK